MENTLKDFVGLLEHLVDVELKTPVAQYTEASGLCETVNLRLGQESSDDSLIRVLKDVLEYTPKVATNKFFNQLFGGRQPKAVLGELLSVMLNNSMYTYKVAGPQVLIEKEVLARCLQLLGLEKFGSGTFCAGGSMGNFMSMVMARDSRIPESKEVGVVGKLIAYTSSGSHYSNAKNASFCGIGRQNIRYISVDSGGVMIVEELERQIKSDLTRGLIPFYVNATAGTTVLGAFDPILEISKIARQYNVWLHVDGAYCGAVFFSDKFKHLISGVECADSFSFNAHKMLGTPLSCSILLVKNGEDLHNSFSNEASYLYQTSNDDLNLGKTSFQCGRRNDALKLWTLWKSVGDKGLREMVDKLFALAAHAKKYVVSTEHYIDYGIDNSLSVCFTYKGVDSSWLCKALYESGNLVVGHGSFREVSFVRLVLVNANNSFEDIDQFFRILEKFVEEHEQVIAES